MVYIVQTSVVTSGRWEMLGKTCGLDYVRLIRFMTNETSSWFGLQLFENMVFRYCMMYSS
ncbi:uncharacterized protein PHALS_14641 [Plasmopara halstedii]|uniref:Uncharacterized protein n=1 Tax=Plasmopara halstedii TaxID=4781 RepID=A0A0P1ANC7_PLAHL|nr:uncharacterized protein PHALS_14641 [Plasmopara halstedii]CEG42622.1 hypothetical protein PHALS_14641 [Plasmopara halstedii]|eukprot:XP_024578991.1 hypothetical protein PHALS_14641 [Plasmopara halstedii]